ncbi:MAG: thiamine ABC transporter substrate-binding protein [Thermotogae bacterium]|nr:thiamine ABC transporter substrate-binding protein [Thermotogota bacterium]
MKKTIIFLFLTLIFTFSFSAKLTVYTYESMGWIKDEIIGEFESKYNCDVNVITLGDGGNVLARVKLEKNNPRADIIMGLDQSLYVTAEKENLLESYVSPEIVNIKNKELLFDDKFLLTPFDYGAIAFVYNPAEMEIPPKSFNDFISMKKSIIIQDPRTSSTGQSFLLWTIAVFKDNWENYWKDLKDSILTVSPGWDESFAKFETGEAPIMVSYATDGAYSAEYYGSSTYKAFIPDEGGYVQIEGAGIVKGTKNRHLAEKFIDFILSESFQEKVPLNQWMFPVTEVKLPKSFDYAVIPDKIISISSEEIAENIDSWIKKWINIMY